MSQMPKHVELGRPTLEAFEAYIRAAEAEMERSLRGELPFLWVETDPEKAQRVLAGETVAECWSGKHPVKVTEGLVHDWIGASLIPRATVKQTLELIQNYDNHKNIYKPEVIESALLSHSGNDFQIYLRLLKKKIITVVLDTHHDVHYSSLDSRRWLCRSYTTRIAEVEGAGTDKEKTMPADFGYGFLWRLYSYWRIQERDGNVFIECRAISLTRDVPTGLGWILKPIIRDLPRESLIGTLEATRNALSVEVLD